MSFRVEDHYDLRKHLHVDHNMILYEERKKSCYECHLKWYSWRDPLGRFGMTQFVDVGPETTIWTFDPLCWSTNLLLCRWNPNVHFVVSPILSDTLCWFWSNNESTICTIDQFCWCGWLFLKSTFLTVDKFCWFVVDTESTIFVNTPDFFSEKKTFHSK